MAQRVQVDGIRLVIAPKPAFRQLAAQLFLPLEEDLGAAGLPSFGGLLKPRKEWYASGTADRGAHCDALLQHERPGGAMLDAWKRFVEGHAPVGGPSKIIVESWERCRAFETSFARAHLRRVPLSELRTRLERNARLVSAARPHLVWALATMNAIRPVVLILVDADGIVLESTGNAPEAITEFGLTPGHDWSERAMGTNGLGTALAHRAPVAVVGAEHYTATWHNNTCVGAPIRGPDGEIIGAVDISTSAADGDPSRLVLVSFLAHLIERDLGVPGTTGLEAFAPDDLLRRAGTAETSSVDPRGLERHAGELARLSGMLAEAAHLAANHEPHAAPLQTLELATLVRRAAAKALRDVKVSIRAPTVLTGPWSESRLEQALEWLLSVSARASSGELEVLVEKQDGELRLSIHARRPEQDEGSRAEVIENSGRVLGQWIAQQLFRACGGTLEVNPAGGCLYRARWSI